MQQATPCISHTRLFMLFFNDPVIVDKIRVEDHTVVAFNCQTGNYELEKINDQEVWVLDDSRPIQMIMVEEDGTVLDEDFVLVEHK